MVIPPNNQEQLPQTINKQSTPWETTPQKFASLSHPIPISKHRREEAQ